MPIRNILALIGLALLCCGGLAPRAHAEPVFVVNSTLDQVDADTSDGICATAAGTCTLRAAIMQANRMSGVGVTIQLPAGTYTLVRPRTATGGDMDGDLDLTAGNPWIHIVGSGRDTTIIDANQIDRAFNVGAYRTATISSLSLRNGYGNDGGMLLNGGTLTLEGVTIQDSASRNAGGAFYNSKGAKLVLNDVVIRDAEAIGDGGGIYNAGDLTLDKSQVLNSVAGGDGGGVFSPPNSKLTVRYSVLSGNSAESGGAIYSEAWFYVLASTISGNVARREGGGLAAISTPATGATVRLIENSAIIGNRGRFWGGGVFNERPSSMRIVSSTIVGNEASNEGGGIDNSGTLDIYNSTIAFNMVDPNYETDGRSGGIFVSGTTSLRNTLVAKNYRAGAPVSADCAVRTYGSGSTEKLHSYGRNLFGDVEGCKIVTKTGSWGLLTSGSLGTFGNNGGPTMTVALRAGSNAIDAGTLEGGCRDHRGALPLDQRGFPRVGACDIGAFEFGATDPDLIFRHGFEG